MLSHISLNFEITRLRGSTTTNRKTVIITRKRGFLNYDIFKIIAIIVVFLTTANSMPHGHPHQRTIRLCSTSLSNALYLICHGRGGYNEPFSYSGEDLHRGSTGPGLVDECCYHSCSYEQLEQYCKPLADEKTNGNDSQDGIEESLRIVNLPYTAIKEFSTHKRAITIEKINNASIDKSKNGNFLEFKKGHINKSRKHFQRLIKVTKVGRYMEKKKFFEGHLNKHDSIDNDNFENNIDEIHQAYVTTTTRNFSKRLGRPECPRCNKVHRKFVVASVPKFKIGRTLPDPKNSNLIIFPSKTNLII